MAVDDRMQLIAQSFVLPNVYGTDENPSGPAFEGYWCSERVRGWAVAYFAKDQGLRIVDCNLGVMAAVPYYRGRYSSEIDAFIFDDGHNPLEIYPGQDYLIDGRIVRLYNIGGQGQWIWQTATRFGSGQ